MGEGFGYVKEVEVGVERDAYALERHDGFDDVGEIRRNAGRIEINDLGHFVGQIFEERFAEFEIEIVFEQLFDRASVTCAYPFLMAVELLAYLHGTRQLIAHLQHFQPQIRLRFGVAQVMLNF